MHYWKVPEKLPAPTRRREEAAKGRERAVQGSPENRIVRMLVEDVVAAEDAGADTITKTSISFSAP